MLLLAVACSRLDAEGANRCLDHADCASGRVCESGSCRPLAKAIEGTDRDGGMDGGRQQALRTVDGQGRTHSGRSGGPTEVRDAALETEDAAAQPGDAASGTQDTPTPMSPDGTDVETGGTVQLEPQAPEVSDDGDAAQADEDAGQSDSCSALEVGNERFALRLDAHHGVAGDGEGYVEGWTDRSRHRHAARPIGPRETWPILVPDAHRGHPAVQFGVVGAGPAVRRLRIEDHTSLHFGTDDFALIAVLRYRNPTEPVSSPHEIGCIYSKQCGSCAAYPGPAFFANDNWSQFVDGGSTRSSFSFQLAARTDYAARSQTGGYNDGNVRVVAARRVAQSLSIEINNVRHATGTAATNVDVSSPQTPVAIGAHPTTDSQSLDGQIFELIAVTGSAARDVTVLVECLMAKYDIE